MKVKCVKNTAAALPEGIYSYKKETQFHFTLNNEYVVYGIVSIKRFPWFLVCEDHFDGVSSNYPVYIYFGCFTITDGSLSRFWKAADDMDIYNYNEKSIMFGFEELVSEKNFYSNLLEGYEREVKIFNKIKKVMDAEFL